MTRPTPTKEAPPSPPRSIDEAYGFLDAVAQMEPTAGLQFARELACYASTHIAERAALDENPLVRAAARMELAMVSAHAMTLMRDLSVLDSAQTSEPGGRTR